MSRLNRLALLAAAALLLIVVGTVLATPAPSAPPEDPGLASSHEPEPQDQPEAPPSAEDLAHAAERLTARGFPTDAATLAPLAEQYGLGGAIRLTAWQSPDHDLTELQTMRDGGMGWGQIARAIDAHPGIGWIMGNGPAGRGLEHAPGQQNEGDDSE